MPAPHSSPTATRAHAVPGRYRGCSRSSPGSLYRICWTCSAFTRGAPCSPAWPEARPFCCYLVASLRLLHRDSERIRDFFSFPDNPQDRRQLYVILALIVPWALLTVETFAGLIATLPDELRLAGSVAATGPAQADTELTQEQLTAQDTGAWSAAITAGAGLGPDYPGAEAYEWGPGVSGRVQYKQYWAAFGASGLRINLWPGGGGVAAGPMVTPMG